jgi:hypothetical protein
MKNHKLALQFMSGTDGEDPNLFVDNVARLEALLDKLVQDTVRVTSELCAQHVDAQECVVNSGMPAEVMIKMVAKTLRSEDWNQVVLDQLSKE